MDVRTIAKSRHNPLFMQEALAASVRSEGITYRRAKLLGELRHVRKDSVNGAWRNASFKGYADYMQTSEFADAVDDLVQRSTHNDVAIMCAEAVPWQPVAVSRNLSASYPQSYETLNLGQATSRTNQWPVDPRDRLASLVFPPAT